MTFPGDKPHGLLEELGAHMGAEAAMRLVAVFGGGQLYVPATATRAHPLAAVLGVRSFRRLVDAWGGETISVPDGAEFVRLRRLRRVTRLLADGAKVDEIARHIGVTPRTVRNLRARAHQMMLDGRRLPSS